MAVQRLSPADRLMLWPDAVWPQENGALLLLEGGPLHGPEGQFRLDAVRSAVAARLQKAPRLRQLLCLPGRGLGGPFWADSPDFDVADHVHLEPVPAPGGEAELLQVVERLRRRRLERSRPLWGMWFLTGLAGGRVALFVKLHHAAADGLAGMATLAALLQPEPGAASPPAEAWAPAPAPTRGALLEDGLRARGRSLRAGARAAAHPLRSARGLGASWPALRELVAETPPPATSLDGRAGPDRALALLRGRFGDLQVVAHAQGVTVNDLLLEVLAGGLRGLLQARGELRPESVVRSYVPVSLRLRGEGAGEGNAVAQMVVPLPVGIADRKRRLAAIAAGTGLRKARVRPELGVLFRSGLVGSLVGRLLPVLLARQRVNVTTADLPGPPQPLYFLGAEILELYPLLPLVGNITLGLGAISYAGGLHLLAVADRALYPDLAVFASAAREELAGLESGSRPILAAR